MYADHSSAHSRAPNGPGAVPCLFEPEGDRKRASGIRHSFRGDVTAAVLAGFYLVTVAQPFILWIGVAISALVYRSIGAWQIWLINNRRLPDGFKVSRLNTWLLWITVVTGLGGVGYWAVTVLPVEACKQAKLFCP